MPFPFCNWLPFVEGMDNSVPYPAGSNSCMWFNQQGACQGHANMFEFNALQAKPTEVKAALEMGGSFVWDLSLPRNSEGDCMLPILTGVFLDLRHLWPPSRMVAAREMLEKYNYTQFT